jgi:hypothetical protein
VNSILEEPLDPCEKIIILLVFLFIKNFESPKTYIPIKSYANCKLHTFQTLNLESVLLANLLSNVFLNFFPFCNDPGGGHI